MRRTWFLSLAVVALLVGSTAVLLAYNPPRSPTTGGTSSCGSNYTGTPIRSVVQGSTHGHVTEFDLPGSSRAPNAIAVAPDGSVWFGEESLPALAHLFTNGTLLEYVWPGTYPPAGAINYSCGYRTQVWGVALWNGTVWATDASGNQLVSLDPVTGRFHFFSLDSGSFPYYVVAGPDGRLWFTELFAPAIGRLDVNGSVQVYSLPTGIRGTPTQVYFVNSTYALYADAGQAGEENGGVFSFNPAHPSFIRIGGSRLLSGLTGLTTTSSGVWVSEHGPPYVEFYNNTAGTWTDFPTSSVPYSTTTLPYFAKSDSTRVWFNEHYGDRMSEIDTVHQSMVEYAVSNPPAANLSGISVAQTIARDGSKIWFTELSGNRVGYADFSTPPPFEISPLSPTEATLPPGGSKSFSFQLSGQSQAPVTLRYTDSETQTGTPTNLNASSSARQFSNLGGGMIFSVTIRASPNAAQGAYVFDVTVSDGSTSYTAFLRIVVT